MFNDFDSTTIPAWFVALNMFFAGIMWILVLRRKKGVNIHFAIFPITMILEGFVYLLVYQFSSPDVETRGFYSRLMIVILSFSQWFPLLVSYIRSFQK